MYFALLVSSLVLSSADLGWSAVPKCPTADSLNPCTCDLEGISCNKVIDGAELRRSMSAHDGSSEYRGFWLVESNVREVLNGTFKYNAFRNVYFPNNKIERIEVDAFVGLESSTRVLDLQSNSLKDVPYAALSKITLLQELVLAKNKIESIPDGAFVQFLNVYDIRLEGNRITNIGKKAFDITGLRIVNLSNNRLTSIGELAFFVSNSVEAVRLIADLSYNEIDKIASDAFDGRDDALDKVDLKGNGIMYFKEEMFGQIMQIVNITIGVTLDVSSNMIVCDDHMKWILKYPVEKRQRIHGIMCLKDGIIVDMKKTIHQG